MIPSGLRKISFLMQTSASTSECILPDVYKNEYFGPPALLDTGQFLGTTHSQHSNSGRQLVLNILCLKNIINHQMNAICISIFLSQIFQDRMLADHCGICISSPLYLEVVTGEKYDGGCNYHTQSYFLTGMAVTLITHST